MSNLADLTAAQIAAMAGMIGATITIEPQHPLVGKYVLLRCKDAGVHTGTLASFKGDSATLANSRRLWQWKANAGIALSGVAQTGLVAGCKVDLLNETIALTGVIEVILCTKKAQENIDAY